MSETVGNHVALGSHLCPWLIGPMDEMLESANSGSLSHAWLISGKAGVGKVNFALYLANRILSDAERIRGPGVLPPQTANEAMRSRHQPSNHHPDLHWVFPEDGKRLISVEQIREAAEAVFLTSFTAAAKVLIIEPAEAMTTAAANALLKTLEEPPIGTYLLLVSELPARLPATVRSRCQHLNLREPATLELRDWLAIDGLSTDALAALRDLTGAGPIELVEAIDTGVSSKIGEYRDYLNAIHDARLDPFAVAEELQKEDLDRVMSTMIRMLQLAIRGRFLATGSNRVTDSPGYDLHNLCQRLTLGMLFEQLDKAETLRNQLGTGINVGLALQVLLLGFKRR